MVDLGVHFMADFDLDLVQGFASDAELAAAEEELCALRFKPAPAWLGSFSMICFGAGYGRGRRLPTTCRALALRMVASMPTHLPSGTKIEYNAAFIQKYGPGFTVKPHIDPSTNIGYTSILSLGGFSHPPSFFVDGRRGPLEPLRGDLVVLPCWRDGVRGPLHEVRGHPEQVGDRYILIVNAIELKKSSG